MKKRKGFIYAVIAGTLAAVAGFSMKCAVSSEDISTVLSFVDISDTGLSVLRGLFLVLSLIANSAMLTFVSKATLLSSSVQSVTTSTAVNFTISALLGFLMFREHIGQLGILGIIIIQIGLIVLNNE